MTIEFRDFVWELRELKTLTFCSRTLLYRGIIYYYIFRETFRTQTRKFDYLILDCLFNICTSFYIIEKIKKY